MVAMALWHLELHPDEPEQVYVRRDFQITNIALGEDINDDARCVVKVTHSPINPALLSDSESEDEYDEDEDEEDDEDDDEDEDEDDEAAEEAAMKKKGKVGGKVSVLEGKTVEELEDEGMDSDFDGEAESDDDSDFSLDMEPATAVIAALTPGKIEQASTNLVFTQGEAVIFEVTGKNVVHLMGNYIQQDMPHEHDDYDDLDSELDDEEDDEDEDDEFDDESITEEEAEDMEKMFGGNKRVELLDSKPAAAEGKKRKAETQEVDSPVSAAKSAVSAAASAVTSAAASAANALTGATATTDSEPLSKAAKKKLAKKQKLESGEAAEGVTDKAADKAKEVADKVAASAAPKKEDAKVSKRTTPSGLVIEDKKLGDGPVAKAGKRLGMRYIGKLTNGKQFDANTGGAPFKFVLGRGEVIKGWDEGIAGMKVGGERRLTIPPNLAYGSQKIPGIPPKSTLVFDIKLVSA